MDFINKLIHNSNNRVKPIVTLPDGKIWLDFYVHVENLGDVKVKDGETAISFPAFRIEGFEISHTIPDVEIHYMAHIEQTGDTNWVREGHFVGTRGKSRRLEGISVRLEGKEAHKYDVKYYVHCNGMPSTPIVSNGQFAGTRGESRRCEGIAVWLEPKRTQEETHSMQVEVPYNSYALDSGSESDDIDYQYSKRVYTPSDIFEHIPTLYKYGLGCTKIAEFGVRSVVSTWAFLKALRDTEGEHKTLICCDLEKSKNMNPAQAAAFKNGITLDFIEANDLTVDLKDGVDLLFIDTWHVYPQLKLELEIHSPKVRKYIAMHDTEVDKIHGESVRCGLDIKGQAKASGFSEENIKIGLERAIKEFLEAHPEWRIREVYTNCNGLTILERVAAAP